MFFLSFIKFINQSFTKLIDKVKSNAEKEKDNEYNEGKLQGGNCN